MQNYNIPRRSPKTTSRRRTPITVPQQTASTGPEYPPAPSLGHQEVFPVEKNITIIDWQMAAGSKLKFLKTYIVKLINWSFS